jgi:YHS domain-containing protein
MYCNFMRIEKQCKQKQDKLNEVLRYNTFGFPLDSLFLCDSCFAGFKTELKSVPTVKPLPPDKKTYTKKQDKQIKVYELLQGQPLKLSDLQRITLWGHSAIQDVTFDMVRHPIDPKHKIYQVKMKLKHNEGIQTYYHANEQVLKDFAKDKKTFIQQQTKTEKNKAILLDYISKYEGTFTAVWLWKVFSHQLKISSVEAIRIMLSSMLTEGLIRVTDDSKRSPRQYEYVREVNNGYNNFRTSPTINNTII